MIRFLFIFVLCFFLTAYAGFTSSPRLLNLYVTGKRVPESYILNEIEQLFKNHNLSSPLRNFLKSKLPSFLLPGDSIDVMSGNNGEQIKLHIENHLLPQPSKTFLMFSDHPETIRKSGLLFQGGLIPFRTVRFNYYHVNGRGEPAREILLVVKNRAKHPALLHVLGTSAGPSPWEMEIGHRINVKFLEAVENRIGRIYEIPPQGQVTIVTHSMPPEQLVSGLFELQLILGKPLEFNLYARIPGESLSQELLWDEKDVHARGIYELPGLTAFVKVKTDEEKSLFLGDLPVENLFQGRALKGSYGVLWQALITLENSSDISQQMGIYFQPRGGKATGTFRIDNTLREVSPTPPYKEVLLAYINLSPNETKTIPLVSLPEGASNYPVKIVIRNRHKGLEFKALGFRTLEKQGEYYVSVTDLLESGLLKGGIDLKERIMWLEESPLTFPALPDHTKNRVVFGQVFLSQEKNVAKPVPYLKVRLLSKTVMENGDIFRELLKLWLKNGDAAFQDNIGLVRETTTDLSGYYFFEGVPKGEYEVLVILGRLGEGRIGYWLVPIKIGDESLRRDMHKEELNILSLDKNQ